MSLAPSQVIPLAAVRRLPQSHGHASSGQLSEPCVVLSVGGLSFSFPKRDRWGRRLRGKGENTYSPRPVPPPYWARRSGWRWQP